MGGSMNIDHQRLIAAIEALEGEGYSVVPTKAADDVIVAGAHTMIMDKATGIDSIVVAIWDAMIAKASDGLKNGVEDNARPH